MEKIQSPIKCQVEFYSEYIKYWFTFFFYESFTLAAFAGMENLSCVRLMLDVFGSFVDVHFGGLLRG